jgi:hypothetical protein
MEKHHNRDFSISRNPGRNCFSFCQVHSVFILNRLISDKFLDIRTEGLYQDWAAMRIVLTNQNRTEAL